MDGCCNDEKREKTWASMPRFINLIHLRLICVCGGLCVYEGSGCLRNTSIWLLLVKALQLTVDTA